MGYTVSWQQNPFTSYTYVNVLKVLPAVVSVGIRRESWGFIVGNDVNHCVAIERVPTQMTFVKTNRDPYTKDVMKTLILMVEFGAAEELMHDDTDMTWFIEALEEVHAVNPLVSYWMQKAYFTSKHTV
jgi:hypothetical protein